MNTNNENPPQPIVMIGGFTSEISKPGKQKKCRTRETYHEGSIKHLPTAEKKPQPTRKCDIPKDRGRIIAGKEEK
jgi:hypothetical protein